MEFQFIPEASYEDSLNNYLTEPDLFEWIHVEACSPSTTDTLSSSYSDISSPPYSDIPSSPCPSAPLTPQSEYSAYHNQSLAGTELDISALTLDEDLMSPLLDEDLMSPLLDEDLMSPLLDEMELEMETAPWDSPLGGDAGKWQINLRQCTPSASQTPPDTPLASSSAYSSPGTLASSSPSSSTCSSPTTAPLVLMSPSPAGYARSSRAKGGLARKPTGPIRRSRRTTKLADAPRIHRCNWDGCTKSYPRACDLAKHKKRHVKPFGCCSCTSRFSTQKDRERHDLSKHRKGDHLICPYPNCQHTTARKDNLANHILRKHKTRGESLEGVSHR